MGKAESGKRKAEAKAAETQEDSASDPTSALDSPASAFRLPPSALDSSAFRLPPSALESPLTDSPLFWLAMFAIFGLAAMLAIGPKYALRQGGIETRFQNRQVAGQWQGEAIESAAAVDAARLPATTEVRPLLVPLTPLFAALGVLVAATITALVWRKNKAA